MSQEEEWSGPPSLADALGNLIERLRNRENPNTRELELLNTFIINADFIERIAEEDAEDVEPGYYAETTNELYELSQPRYDNSSDRRIELMQGLLDEYRMAGITLPSQRGIEAKSARKRGGPSRSRRGGRKHKKSKKSKKSKKNRSRRHSRKTRRD